MRSNVVRAGMVVLFWAACAGRLVTIPIHTESETVIEKGTLFEDLVGDWGFGDFADLDISQDTELANQGVEPGDIDEVTITEIALEISDPPDGDFTFIDRLEFYVQAEGLAKKRIASGGPFAAGARNVELTLDDVDLTEYAVLDSMTITTDATGSRPEADTTIHADIALKVGVTGQGACNQLNKDKDAEE